MGEILGCCLYKTDKGPSSLKSFLNRKEVKGMSCVRRIFRRFKNLRIYKF